MKTINDNWVVKNLENSIGTWNEKLSELWVLITQTPETFKGGQIWSVIVNIHSALVGIGYGLLVLFFAMGIFQSAASFRELQRPEFALRHFIRFAAAKVAVGRGMEIMLANIPNRPPPTVPARDNSKTYTFLKSALRLLRGLEIWAF